MQILYLDDSGKVHPNDPAKVAAFAGFSVREDRWHKLIRQITGLKGKFAPQRKPNEWEAKSESFLTPDNWQRAKKATFAPPLSNRVKVSARQFIRMSFCLYDRY